MSYIQQRRLELGLTQAAVANAAGLSRTHYQRIEQSIALPGAANIEALEGVLGLKLMSVSNLVSTRERQEVGAALLYGVEDLSRSTWLQASKLWGMHSLSSDLWSRLCSHFHTDSARECSALAQIASEGAEIRLDSPLLWGFRQHVPVDARDSFLGAVHLPCLFYRRAKTSLVLWPQLRLRVADTTWRLDALGFFREGPLRRWVDIEFDASGHNPTNDAYRGSQLRLPEVRITGQEIAARQTMKLILQRAPIAKIPDFSKLLT